MNNTELLTATTEYDALQVDAVPHSPLYQSWRRLVRNRLAVVGLIIIGVLCLLRFLHRFLRR
jgi:hypothetical protein